MKPTIAILLFFLTTLSFAAVEHTVEVIPFVENQVIPLRSSTFTVTEIQFGADERVQSIQSGDLAAWTVDVSKALPNRLFIKPTISGSNSNLTVVTDQHTYYFHLTSNNNQQSPLYAIKFIYPKTNFKTADLSKPHLPSSYHWNYTFHGSTAVMPLHVFDDGHFTYFQLRPGQSLPAIFAVDTKKGKESVVNFRRENHYLVVHRLAPQFTLRSGAHQVASIFNERLIRSLR